MGPQGQHSPALLVPILTLAVPRPPASYYPGDSILCGRWWQSEGVHSDWNKGNITPILREETLETIDQAALLLCPVRAWGRSFWMLCQGICMAGR